ncbi:MAG TPA: translocation/assembly module TamB domain-containing protein [Labilithrix sp.]|nr:translocation/assembly module TamB domain-containing protein [Labilithrix sp.]
MDQPRSSSTQLPPVRRKKRRDWVRVVCRVVCVLLAVVGLVPIGVGLLARTNWARDFATHETRALIAKFGIDARYELDLHVWPLSVSVKNIRVESSDGGAPFLTARRATAKPKIFGLLAGKVVIDQIEIEQPKARVVLKDGKLENLKLELPETPKKEGPTKAPFSVVSMSEAEVDLTIDTTRIVAREIDADVTVDDTEPSSAFEVALRAGEVKTKLVRTVEPAKGAEPPKTATDDDVLCGLDGRARIEEKRILVRRLSAHGAADMDPAPDTSLGCDLPKTDYRYVELGLGHLGITLPQTKDQIPNVEGHVKVRAPIPLVGRTGPGAPITEGWVGVDVELRYTPETPIPDLTGRMEAHDLRVARFNFAKTLTSEFAVRRGIVTVPLTKLDIADSTTEIRDVEVRPFEKGIPLKVGRVDIQNASFTSLLRDFRIHPRPFVAWDIREVHVLDVRGTADPLKIDGDMNGRTYDFTVFDRPAKEPARNRIIGVRDAALNGKLAVRPKGFEFQNMTVTTPRSVARGVLVAIGYHEELRVEVLGGHIDIGEVSPLGSVVMGGIAEPKVTITGTAGDPLLEGDTTIKDFVIGDIPFGNVTQAHVVSDISNMTVDLTDVKAQKGKSTYEMPTGHLDFNKPANMRLDGQATSKNLNIRDFFSMFHLEEDPRLAEIDGNLETNARIHLALGGPEDVCNSGYLTVAARADAKDLNLLGEKFDEGHADFEYRWVDRLAGIEGAEIDVRSLSLTKVKKEGRASMGSVLGSVAIHRGGDMRGNLVLQGFPLARTDMLGPAAKKVEGAVSGVARIGGKLSAFDIDADVNVTPVRIMGSPFGGSDLHVSMNQKPASDKPIAKTGCGAPIYAAFNKETYLKDTSSQGEYKLSGALFGGQVRLDDIVATRQKAPIITGKVSLDRFDLGPIGKILTVNEDPNATPSIPLGGEISGDISLDRIATGDLAHAKVRFAPKTFRVNRGGQKIELHETQAIVELVDDTLTIPKVTFDLAAPNGLKGAFAVNGTVKKVTRGGDLGLEAELSPIDLGILVGVVPKMTRAVGTLSGKVLVSGNPAEPDLDGRLKVRGGEFGIKGLPGGITEVEVDVEADENEARITRAVGHFLGGDVGMTAHMPLKGGQLGIARATVTGRQLSVTPVDGVRATLDADLEVTLNPNAPSAQGRLPFVGGEVTITQFEYTRPVTLDLTGFKGGAKRTIVEAYDPSADSVSFGIDVHSRAPLHIRNNLVDAKLAIDPRGIHVTGTNQRVGLRGELATLSGGRFRVFANDFEVQKGSIRFDDPTRIAPHVDITGVTEYRRYSNTLSSTGAAGGAGVAAGNISSGGRGGGLWRITLHAYGDTEDLRVDMTSDPALSREDIFFLLTIGLTRAEVDQVRAGSVYASAAFEAIGTVSGADRAVKTAIPVIDDFRFGSAYSPRTGRTEPQVTLGRRLTDNVRANVSTGLTEDRQLRSNVEWRLSRPLSVQTSYDNISSVSSGSVGNFGLDFRWRIEFD